MVVVGCESDAAPHHTNQIDTRGRRVAGWWGTGGERWRDRVVEYRWGRRWKWRSCGGGRQRDK